MYVSEQPYLGPLFIIGIMRFYLFIVLIMIQSYID